MKFEKLNDDKIRITLSHDDLIKNNVDFHSFMTDSIESQELFFDMLKEAEKEIGFTTKDYLLRIEALAMPSSGNFILTVTRSLPKSLKNNSKKKLHIRKNSFNSYSTQAVYTFSSFDDYCSFISFFKDNNFKANNLADFVMLYEYNNEFYLALKNINLTYPRLKNLLYCITEYATFVKNSNIFISKLAEKGNLIMKNNALKIAMKFY